MFPSLQRDLMQREFQKAIASLVLLAAAWAAPGSPGRWRRCPPGIWWTHCRPGWLWQWPWPRLPGTVGRTWRAGGEQRGECDPGCWTGSPRHNCMGWGWRGQETVGIWGKQLASSTVKCCGLLKKSLKIERPFIPPWTGESLINLSLPSNVSLQGQHTYTDRTTPRQGIKSLVFIGLIRINQSQNLCCMITVFTAAKYEIEIECLAGTLINTFLMHGQSSQCYMQNISGM